MSYRALLVLLSCLPCLASCGDAIALELRATEGTVIRQVHTMEQLIKMGDEEPMLQTMEFVWTQEVEEVLADGSMRLALTYDEIRASMHGPVSWEYDSADPDTGIPPFAIGYEQLLGTTLWMTVSPRGRVLDVEGMNDTIRRMMESLRGELDDDAMRDDFDDMETDFRSQFGDDPMLQMMQASFPRLPDERVSIGSTWSHTGAFPFIGPQTTTYTLADRSAGRVHLDMSMVLDGDEPGVMKMGPLEMTMALAGELTGTIQLDERTGWLLESDGTQSFSGEIQMGGPMFDDLLDEGDEAALDGAFQNLPMTLKSTISLRTITD